MKCLNCMGEGVVLDDDYTTKKCPICKGTGETENAPEFTFNYRYGIDLPCGCDTITVNAENEYCAKIKAIETLRNQKRYFGYWLEIIK